MSTQGHAAPPSFTENCVNTGFRRFPTQFKARNQTKAEGGASTHQSSPHPPHLYEKQRKHTVFDDFRLHATSFQLKHAPPRGGGWAGASPRANLSQNGKAERTEVHQQPVLMLPRLSWIDHATDRMVSRYLPRTPTIAAAMMVAHGIVDRRL